MNGKVKKSCAAVGLNRHSRDTAKCKLSFAAGTTHRVRAVYRGDAAFTGSSSSAIREKTKKRTHRNTPT